MLCVALALAFVNATVAASDAVFDPAILKNLAPTKAIYHSLLSNVPKTCSNAKEAFAAGVEVIFSGEQFASSPSSIFEEPADKPFSGTNDRDVVCAKFLGESRSCCEMGNKRAWSAITELAYNWSVRPVAVNRKEDPVFAELLERTLNRVGTARERAIDVCFGFSTEAEPGCAEEFRKAPFGYVRELKEKFNKQRGQLDADHSQTLDYLSMRFSVLTFLDFVDQCTQRLAERGMLAHAPTRANQPDKDPTVSKPGALPLDSLIPAGNPGEAREGH